MIDYMLELLAELGVFTTSEEEQRLLEQGIAQYLLENGIEDTDTGDYYQGYVCSGVKKIDPGDLKTYFTCYTQLSRVRQLAVIGYQLGQLSPEQQQELRGLMVQLYQSGLGERYVPIHEVSYLL